MSEIADLQSELNDETLVELIDFRRTTYRHHVEQENKVQATLHGLVLVALMELQEHRKACALRERAEPVAESDHVRREVHVGGNTWVQCSAQAYERAKAEGKITRELFERPGQPVAVPDVEFDEWAKNVGLISESHGVRSVNSVTDIARKAWNACRAAMLAAHPAKVHVDQVAWKDRIASDITGAYMQGCRDTEARLAAAAGKQQLSVETLSNVIRNAPLAPSDSQGRQREAMAVDCWCRTCRPVSIGDMRFVVCPDCGNKRCPKANDHRNSCTGSNEPGQDGSEYPAAPGKEG